MARRLNMQRLMLVMGVVVLGLGGLCLWAVVRGARPEFQPEPPEVRVLRQAREQLGPKAEIRLLEAGRGRVVCGYLAAFPGGNAAGFVSRPNRLLLSNDPLKDEFKQMVDADCPRFPEPPVNLAVP